MTRAEPAPGGPRAPMVRVEGLRVMLGDYRALDDVSFDLPEGSFLALLGPNGAGKTTLLKALLGVVEPAAGRVTIDGRAPREVGRGVVGYVPQTKSLDRGFPALAIELVVNGLRGSWPARIGRAERATALEALRRAGADHLAGRDVGHLSGGELQRVYTARALVRRPRVVLLDEPAAGMDLAGEHDLYEVLEAYRDETGATIVMITHDWDVSFHHATHVLLLQRRVVGFGTPAEALTDEHVRRAFGHLGHAHPMSMGYAAPPPAPRRRTDRTAAGAAGDAGATPAPHVHSAACAHPHGAPGDAPPPPPREPRDA